MTTDQLEQKKENLEKMISLMDIVTYDDKGMVCVQCKSHDCQHITDFKNIKERICKDDNTNG